jgi:hypothetical protein
MNDQDPQQNNKNLLYRFDSFIKTFIPNFNVRAIVYFTLIFGTALYLEIWQFSSPPKKQTNTLPKQETVLADKKYWSSSTYLEKIKSQTLETFTGEFERWLNNKDQDFSTRKFEDMFFINPAPTPVTEGDLATVVPQNFNYLENTGRARYLYAKQNGFLNDKPQIVKLANAGCTVNETTQQDTGIELYEWRYASVPKLLEFMKTYPDWKMQIGSQIYNVQDQMMTPSTSEIKQRVGLFSFLIFHNPKTNNFVVADTEILDSNGIDGFKTMVGLETHNGKLSLLDFKYGFEGCKEISNGQSPINYGQPD